MKLNQTAYVILGLLSIEPNRSGYDIRKAIQSTVGYFWSESYGQIYPTLKRLAAAGLIAPGKSASTGRKRRQTYVLTKQGRAQLRQWLALPFRNDPPRNEFLLKLFFGREAAPGVSTAHLQDLQERNQRMLAALRKIEASAEPGNPPNPHFPYWMLTLSMGKELTQAALEWGETALAELAALEGAGATAAEAGRKRSQKKGAETAKHLHEKHSSARTKAGGAK